MSILGKIVSVLLGRQKPRDKGSAISIDDWREKSTSRFDLLVDTKSDDGGHFTFNPTKFSLHETLNNGRTHIPLDNGLEAITRWETLRQSSGLEKSVELRYNQVRHGSTDVQKYVSESISRRHDPKPREFKFKFDDIPIPRLELTDVQKYVFESISRRSEFKPIEPNLPDYGESQHFESKLPDLLPLGGKTDSRVPYLMSKSFANSWADKSYKIGADLIKDQMDSLGIQDGSILKHIVPKVTKKDSSSQLPFFGMPILSSTRTCSPGEMLDIRGLPNTLR